LRPDVPDAQVARAWIRYAEEAYDDAIGLARQAIEQKPDCEGAYYLLGRSFFSSGRYQEAADIADAAIKASGEDYNTYIPIENALNALGKMDAYRNVCQQSIQILEQHLSEAPEDVRARMLLAVDYAQIDRPEDAIREANLAIALRPNEAMVLYNAACVFGSLQRVDEALDSLEKAWKAGFKDSVWVRRDPDLASLRGNPRFERLYPDGDAEK
jgi:tetratricopeptide (TPR) repeat protein